MTALPHPTYRPLSAPDFVIHTIRLCDASMQNDAQACQRARAQLGECLSALACSGWALRTISAIIKRYELDPERLLPMEQPTFG